MKGINKVISKEIQKENYFNPNWEMENKNNNQWVKIYYETIDKLIKDGAIVNDYNKLIIKKYVTNSRNEIGEWKYCRHHIDEIKISGAIYSQDIDMMEHYKIDKTILITYEQHLLLHYIIVNANTTWPNHGMLKGIANHFITFNDSFNYWNKVVKEMCNVYNIPYEENWKDKLSVK